MLEGGTGRPLVGVRVTLECLGPNGFVTRTLQTTAGMRGAYEFKTSEIRGCDSIRVHASKDGYVSTPAIDPEFGHDNVVHLVLTPIADARMQNLAVLAMSAHGHRSPNAGYHYVLVFSDFFEATHIAKTEREEAFVRQSFCPLLIDLWSSLSEEDRSFARGQRLQTNEGTAVVDHDGFVLHYCAQ